ncbi:hypothetical protein ACVBEF_18480 [Glaciimonas sp. GG7]
MQTAIDAAVLILPPAAALSADVTEQPRKESQKARQRITGLPHGFTMSDMGVYFIPEGSDDKPGKPIRICSPLRVMALVRDRSSENW